MRCFYFTKTRKQVALWTRHFSSATEADHAFYDSIRLFHPVPAILYDRGYPAYNYHNYLKKVEDEETGGLPSEFRREANW